jgi:hypothetical protein
MKLHWALVSGLVALNGADALAANTTDDVKITQLEQDVRELKRTVIEQARRIEQLERQPPVQPRETSPPNHLRPTAPDAPWLDAANWKRVQIGSAEDEVRKILGAPTTVRDSTTPGEQTLFYASELHTDSFLAGFIKVKNHRVTEIQAPVLK